MFAKRFGTVAGVIVALGLPSGANAQDTVPPPPAPPAGMTQTGKHVVQAGETLWGIARLYMGDPLLWPEIYRLNTAVVEDPHWIFPGEELLLAPADQTAVQIDSVTAAPPVQAQPPVETPPVQPPAAQPPVQQQAEQRPPEQTPPPVLELPTEAAPAAPPPPAIEGATVFARQQSTQSGTRLGLAADDHFRAIRPGDFYAAGWLTEEREFPWAEVLGNTDPAGEKALVGRSALYRQVIQIRAPVGANYQVGDSLVTYTMLRKVDGWGEIAHPTGIVRILHVAGRDILGDVITQFDQVRQGQRALPAEPFPDAGSARPRPVADGVMGGIITLRAIREVPKQFDALFIDLGRNAGIVPGDILEILPRPEEVQVAERPADAIALLQVVHTTERSATALVTGIFTPGIRVTVSHAAGAPVRLIRKMP